MRQSGAMEFVFVGGLVALFAAMQYFSKEAKLKRQLRAAPIHSLAAVPEGTLVRVVGKATALDDQTPLLRAPLSGRPCLMYFVKVEPQGSSSGHSIRETNAIPFMLTDANGKAVIDATAAYPALIFDRDVESVLLDPAKPAENEFLARHGRSAKAWIFDRALRYREGIIEVGETIAILGIGFREPDPDGTPSEGYRSAPPTRIRFTSSPKYPLVISDDPTTMRPAQNRLPPASKS